MDQNNRPMRYYNINDPNDRPPIDAPYGPIHYYRIIEPDGLPPIDDEHPSIEFDDPPHDSRPESDSLRGSHEPVGFNYVPYRRQSSPYFDAIEFLPDDHRDAREAAFGPIEFEDRSYPDNMPDTRGRHETYDAEHARYMRRLRQQSPYFDPIELDKEHSQAREAHFEEIDPIDPYVGPFGFDPSRVEFEPIDIDKGYSLRRQEREERRRRGQKGSVSHGQKCWRPCLSG